jgi:hypothetical protein
MSHTYRFTAASYDNFPASEWASPRFVMVSLGICYGSWLSWAEGCVPQS